MLIRFEKLGKNIDRLIAKRVGGGKQISVIGSVEIE